MKRRARTEFQAVDVDLRGANVRSVVNALTADFFPCQLRDTQACLELREQEEDIEMAISKIVMAIESLTKRDRSQWERLQERQVNIAIHAGLIPHQVRFPISLAALAGLSEIKVDLVFTVYSLGGTGD